MYIGVPDTFQFSNLLDNGSLYNSTNDWEDNSGALQYHYTASSSGTYTTITCSDDSALSDPIQAVSSNGFLQTLSSVISGNTSETKQVIYIQAKIKGYVANGTSAYPLVLIKYTNSAAASAANHYSSLLSIDGKIGSQLNDGEWHTMSIRCETYDGWEPSYYKGVIFGLGPGVTGCQMDIKEVMLFNLTTVFGARQ